MIIWKWFNFYDEEDYYYDVSDNDKLQGAALCILEIAFDSAMFPKPTPIEQDYMYQKSIRRRDALLIALNGNTDETFSSMHRELEIINHKLANRKRAHDRRLEQHNTVADILEQRDGPAAIEMVYQVFSGELYTITPASVSIEKAEDAEA